MTPAPEILSASIPAIEGGTPVRSNFLVFGKPYIGEDEIQEVVKTLRSGWIGTGPRTIRFEEEFRAYKKSDYAISVNSCTAALHLSMLALGVRPGDEVITTPMTFCATANAIIHAGAKPVFADCQRETMNIDPSEVARKITPKTKAIIPVHFAGRPCDMDALVQLAEDHSLHIIEDCAHATETLYHGKHAGTFGDAGCFSFYVTKNVVTGEGGMVITDQKTLEQRVKVLALHGMSKDAWKRFSDTTYTHYEVTDAGFKYNMTDMQAAMGLHQLRAVEIHYRRRQQIWDRYDMGLRDLPCFLPAGPAPDTRHALHLYTILVDLDRLKVSRDHLLAAFGKERMGVGVHYLALHTHPFYHQFLRPGEGFPNAEYISQRTISLPLSVSLSDDDVDSVIRTVRKLLLYYSK
jgi:dTDP-4-amino-4,6-dideoxygalactose transaminase